MFEYVKQVRNFAVVKCRINLLDAFVSYEITYHSFISLAVTGSQHP
jgi:hypothetical protein